MGNIVLRVNASIQQEIADLAAAETQWNRLLTKYGTPTITGVFRDFKEALNIRLKTDGHPGNQIDRWPLLSSGVLPPPSLSPNNCRL